MNYSNLVTALVSFIVGALTFGFLGYAIAWTGPTGSPPGSNVSAPLHVGATSQSRTGALSISNLLDVNSLSVWGDAILSGTSNYLNFGTTPGSSGFGIRNNAGNLEFKSSVGGAWNTLTNIITTVLGSGAVTSVKFSDGTTQTTAGTGTFRNWERILAHCTGQWCVANCTGTKKVLGGGCSGSDHLTYGYPYNANKAWRCRSEQPGDTIEAWAICADVD